MATMRLLLVEDDEAIGGAIAQGFAELGIACTWRRGGVDGLASALGHEADIIVLDQMLPDLPGLKVLANLRAAGVRTPVLILSALGTVEDRVSGLQRGADDYLVKPFAFAELQARVEALTRRAVEPTGSTLTVGPLSLDLATRRVLREGREVEITPTEFSLLEFLLRHAGRVVSRRMVCEHLWEADWEGVTNVVDVHVSRLRAKIDRGFDASLLQTVRGRGYVLRAAPADHHDP